MKDKLTVIQYAQICALLNSGKKLHAIKLIRLWTGADYESTKAFVDSIEGEQVMEQ